VIVLHDRRQEALAERGEQRESTGDHERDGGAAEDREGRTAGSAARGAARDLEPCVGDDEEREADVPEHVEPGCALRSGAEQAGRREETGERERVRDGHERGEQVGARQHLQGTGSQDAELTEQQHRRHQVIDHQRGLVDGNEGPDLPERTPGEWRQRQKDRSGCEHDREREPALAAARR
jgi:hypothetical protein